MAAEDDIEEVRDMIGADGWGDDKITEMLDEGDSPVTIARKYWESQMASSTTLADVSESGSSRKLQQIFSNRAAMAAYFRGAEAAEDENNQPAGSFSREMRRA